MKLVVAIIVTSVGDIHIVLSRFYHLESFQPEQNLPVFDKEGTFPHFISQFTNLVATILKAASRGNI